MKKYSFKFLSSIAIILFSLFFAVPSLIDVDSNLPSWMIKNKLKLGLDLQGGSQLLLQVETQKAIQEKMGARPIKRIIQKLIENELSRLILSKTLPSGGSIKFSLKKDELDYKIQRYI